MKGDDDQKKNSHLSGNMWGSPIPQQRTKKSKEIPQVAQPPPQIQNEKGSDIFSGNIRHVCECVTFSTVNVKSYSQW